MHPSAAKLIRESFTAIAATGPDAPEVLAASFYTRLFAAHPQVRPFFPADMARQRKHLAAALALVCRNIDRIEMLEEPLMQLGAQHLRYGTRPEHYPIIVTTLIATLKEASGPAWNPATESAWTTALNHIAAIMLKGAARANETIATQLS